MRTIPDFAHNRSIQTLSPTPSMTCDTCGKEITECPVCGGYVCAPNCPDRDDDGCTCDMEESFDSTDEE